ncbi:MAG TPA: DUF4097 family beta strand repeat-containing protein, partial [Pyrinomonadaceae bacterium]|nr:DUF4097 family beta strand repeat-containing protein [Pyrinomonadaceae bacterium]
PYATANYAAAPPQPVSVRAPSVPAGAQPAPRRRGVSFGWVLLALLICCIGGAAMAGYYIYTQSIKPLVREIKVAVPKAPAAPRAPQPPARPADADADVLDEDDADVSDNKTVITKTFPLAPDEGEFDVTNLNGNITVEGWDEAQAEVTMTKRGGTPDEREATEIKLERNDNHLALHTEPGGAGDGREVNYEVKLPRRLQHLSLSTMNGNVTLTGLHAGVEISTQNGNVKLEDVGGAVATKTVHGNTKIVLPAEGRDAAQVYNAVNGNIEVQLKGDTNADLKAESTTGAIEAEEALGLNVVKQIVGQRAAGRIGQGGPAIVIKTLSGNIKIKK